MSGGGDLYACVDVGTSNIKLCVYDSELVRRHSETASVPVDAHGLQDAELLYRAVRHLLDRGKELGARSAGLATYRASTVAWRKDGTPLTPVVTWTDRKVTSTYRGLPAYFKLIGKIPPLDLIISPYSPVMKFLRLRELNPALPEDCMQWTVDGYLAYRLTGEFVSDPTNACLTGLVDPRSMKEIGIVRSLFKLKFQAPRLVENSERIGDAGGIELNALSADQQAACIGEWALEKGSAKVTNGTGTFVDVPTDGFARRGELIPMVLLKHRGRVWYGVEGYLPTTGVAVNLLLSMGLIRGYDDLEVAGDGGVLFIPALTGLQVPRAPDAKGMVTGLDMGSDRRALVSGLLKAIAFHVRFVLEQAGERPRVLKADGGLSKSGELLRRISAAANVDVVRSADLEATSRGLAMLQIAATGKGRLEDLAKVRQETEVFSRKPDAVMEEEYEKWRNLTTWLKSSPKSSPAE